ncbi:protease SohB [Gammaproteobacteria bacterium]|nr:protease SohB [Gammaproteobacteria bacterium]
MDFLFEYLMFLAQAVTIVIALLIIISSIAGMSSKNQSRGDRGRLSVQKVNDLIKDLRYALEANTMDPGHVKKARKKEQKEESKKQKQKTKELKKKPKQDIEEREAEPKKAFVIEFDGDVKASALDNLRLEITAVLTMAGEQDEVVICLESPGGMVHSYGLAASQLARIKSKGIPLTVVVDKVAASGGYLMASVADKILSAPFALIGSIGVVAQIPNVHKLLKKNDVDVELLTAGKYKRTLSVFGENTEEGREKFKEELEDVHLLFQEFVSDNRPGLDIDQIATGEAWYGKRALELKLVDALLTSDQYLSDLCEEREVYQVQWEEMKSPVDKILGKVNGTLDRFLNLLDGVFK